ncbi:MAG: hypothetical protein DRH17_12510 [Deltaproteobacteria bacterium]|nr:MAG: hypothetical protein DRH17_12510 [Deltaproteobacteria bacterium]
MAVIFTTAEGYKIAKNSGSAENTGGAAADVDATITFSELEKVLYVIAAYGDVPVTEKSISGNQVTVTAKSVPAGTTATVYVVVLGF